MELVVGDIYECLDFRSCFNKKFVIITHIGMYKNEPSSEEVFWCRPIDDMSDNWRYEHSVGLYTQTKRFTRKNYRKVKNTRMFKLLYG
jgi:hypothetical protein